MHGVAPGVCGSARRATDIGLTMTKQPAGVRSETRWATCPAPPSPAPHALYEPRAARSAFEGAERPETPHGAPACRPQCLPSRPTPLCAVPALSLTKALAQIGLFVNEDFSRDHISERHEHLQNVLVSEFLGEVVDEEVCALRT